MVDREKIREAVDKVSKQMSNPYERIILEVANDVLEGRIGYKLQPYWYVDENDKWHQLCISEGKYYIDGVFKAGEMATEQEIRAMMAKIDPNPILSEYDKEVAKALVGKVAKKEMNRKEMIKVIQGYTDKSCCVTCKKCSAGIADALLGLPAKEISDCECKECVEKNFPIPAKVCPFVSWAKDHYWDSLEKDRGIIIKHIEDNFGTGTIKKDACDGKHHYCQVWEGNPIKPISRCLICGHTKDEIEITPTLPQGVITKEERIVDINKTIEPLKEIRGRYETQSNATLYDFAVENRDKINKIINRLNKEESEK